MSQIPMSEEDWEAALAEWRESLNYQEGDSVGKFEEQYLTRPESNAGRWVKCIAEKGNGTPKARFFFTAEAHGFWCPRTAILSLSHNQVYVADWCKITTIEYR